MFDELYCTISKGTVLLQRSGSSLQWVGGITLKNKFPNTEAVCESTKECACIEKRLSLRSESSHLITDFNFSDNGKRQHKQEVNHHKMSVRT